MGLSHFGKAPYAPRPARVSMLLMSSFDRRWLPLNALRAFEAVASRLSFTAGAHALRVSQSALSRHVIGLEELLGPPPPGAPPARPHADRGGRRPAARGRPAPSTASRTCSTASCATRRPAPRTLRVHMPPSFLQQLGLPIVQDFRREFPEILVDVSTSYGTGLPARDLDVAVVYDRPQVSDNRSRPVVDGARHAGVRARDCGARRRAGPRGVPARQRAAARQAGGAAARRALGRLRPAVRPQPRHWPRRRIRYVGDRGAVRHVRHRGGLLPTVDMFAREIGGGQAWRRRFPAVLEDGYGYYLTLHPESLADPAVATFRSWMIARFAGGR